MRIHFQGLIVQAHVPNATAVNEDIAVLMGEPTHIPLFSIHENDVVKISPPGTPNNGVYCFDLTGLRVTTDLGAGGSTVSFLENIPSLVALTGGTTVDPSVTSRTPGGNFHSFVDLPPAGMLTVEDFFPCDVDFGKGAFAGSLGHTLVHYLTAAALPKTVTFTLDGNGTTTTVEVIRNADVWISNRCEADAPPPPDCTGTPSTAHSDYYSKFFSTQPTMTLPTKTGKCQIHLGPADVLMCGEPATLDVDCANSRFP